MTFLEKLDAIERIDQLTRMKATGTPAELAKRLEISKRSLFDLINLMKAMGAPISFCHIRKTYSYDYPCELNLGFTGAEKVKGGASFFLQYNLVQIFRTPDKYICEVATRDNPEPCPEGHIKREGNYHSIS